MLSSPHFSSERDDNLYEDRFPVLLLLLAKATDRALARHVQYLKAENQILRSKLPARIAVTPKERQRLIKFDKPIAKAIKELISIVLPRTFLRWLQGDEEAGVSGATKPSKPGRPRTEQEIRDLVVKLATENSWGYTRILCELRKLGVRKISRTTVVNILKEKGLDPGPKRGEGTWDDFIKRHAETLVACEFFSKRVWTMGGLVDIFCLFFINVSTRRVFVSGLSANPDRGWMAQRARNAVLHFAEQPGGTEGSPSGQRRQVREGV
jgi:putative transposase